MQNENLNTAEILNEYLSTKKAAKARETLTNLLPVDIAEILQSEVLDKKLFPVAFRLLSKDVAAQTFIELDAQNQENLILSFSDFELAQMLDELFVDDAVDIIEEMPANVVRRIIKNCDKQMREQINKILEYPSDSAGSIMTPEYIYLRRDMTVNDAFNVIRRAGLDSETIYTCYVISKSRRLLGVVTVRQLLLADTNQTIEEIMEENVISVETHTDKEEVTKLFDKYDFLAFPVVDKENRLVGIITVDDAIDVIRDEVTEDFSKMAAVAPIDESYFSASVFKHAKNRILWLVILMVSAMITGGIINAYQETFALYPLLIACLPMLMSTGGNCGAQTSTMIIRGMATDEIRPKNVLKVWFKEVRISLLIGIALAIINFGRVLLVYGFTELALGLTSSLAIMFTVTLAQTLGCLLPIVAKVAKLDPAIMASPLITTIVDALSVAVFFGIATWIFNI